MHVLYPLLISLFLLSGLACLAWAAELQATIVLVLDKGGLYLNYTSGIGRFRISGFRIRLSSGRGPRAWKRVLLTGRYGPAAFAEIYQRTTSKQWNTLQIPLRSSVRLGVKIIIREINVRAKIGLEDDSAATALLCGFASAFLQALRAVSTRGEFTPLGSIEVSPVFGQDRLSIHLKFIITIKARHIIKELVKDLPSMVNNKLREQKKANPSA